MLYDEEVEKVNRLRLYGKPLSYKRLGRMSKELVTVEVTYE